MAGIRKPSPVKNLYLPGIRLPVGGVVSILHRVSGVLMVALLPASLWILQQSLAGPERYAELVNFLNQLPGRILVLLLVLVGTHHLLAGVRHLFQDIDIGITRSGGRRGAWLVLAGGLLAAVLAGWCLFR